MSAGARQRRRKTNWETASENVKRARELLQRYEFSSGNPDDLLTPNKELERDWHDLLKGLD